MAVLLSRLFLGRQRGERGGQRGERESGCDWKDANNRPAWPIKAIRPIVNLSTVSKVLKRLALTRLRPHLLGSANISQFPSAYRKAHSTKTDDYSGKVKNHRSVI